MKKTLLRFRNPDSTLDLNTQFSKFFSKGLVEGGEVLPISPNSQPQITVSPFKLIGTDGMVVLETALTETLTLPTSQVSVVCFRSIYVSNADPDIGFEVIEISAYNTLPQVDKENRIVFATVTSAGPTDTPIVSYDLRDVIDPVSRNVLRGYLDTPASLPLTNNRLGDAYIIESGIYDPTNNGLWVWRGSNWFNITETDTIASELTAHRSNLNHIGREQHVTDDEYAAIAGTYGSPSATNKFVTDLDPRVPTQNENDALVGLSQTVPTAPSATNRFVTEAYSQADPDSTLFTSPWGATLQINGSPLAGIFVGTSSGMASALKYFGAFDPVLNREYLNSSGSSITLTGVYKSVSPLTPLDPATEASIANSNGFWNSTLYLTYSGAIDSNIRIRYGVQKTFTDISRGFALKIGPQDAQTSAETLQRMAAISGRLMDDPMQTGETNKALRTSQLDIRRYLNTTTVADMVVPTSEMKHLRSVSDIAADFTAEYGEIVEFNTLALYTTYWSASDVANFDPAYTEDLPVVAYVQYAMGTILPSVQPGWIWQDDLGQRFRILAYNPAQRTILLYTGGLAINVNNANGSQSQILRANNPRQLELIKDHETWMYREFFPVDDISALKDQFEALPPGGVYTGSYTPVNNFSLISTNALPNQGNPNGTTRGRPLFQISPKENANRYNPRILLIGNWKSDQTNNPRQAVGDLSQGALGIEYTGRLTSLVLWTAIRASMPYGFRVFIDGVYNHAASQFLTSPNISVGLLPSNVINNLRGATEKQMQPLYFNNLGLNDNLIHTVRIEATQAGTASFPLYGISTVYSYGTGAIEDKGRSFVSTDYVKTDTTDSFTPIVSSIRGSKVVRYIDRTNKVRQSASSNMLAVYDNAVSVSAGATTVASSTLAASVIPGDVLLFTTRPISWSDTTQYVYRRVLTVDRYAGSLTIDSSLGFALAPGRVELVFRIPATTTGTPVVAAPASPYSTEYARFFLSDWTVGKSSDVAQLGTTSPDTRITVLDDGSTAIAVKDCKQVTSSIEGATQAIRLETLTAAMVINAWCTRMDVVFVGSGGVSSTVNIEVDGQISYSITVPNDGLIRHTCFFDAAPQSHTVKIYNPSVAATVAVSQWLFHTIKSPTIDGSAISEYEIPRNSTSQTTNYYDFAPTNSTNPLVVSNAGVRVFDITKYGARYYEGTGGSQNWTATQDLTLNPRFGYYLNTDRTNAVMEITFVGSHFELYYYAGPTSGIAQMYLDDVVASGSWYPNQIFGTGSSYAVATGQLDQYAALQTLQRIVFTDLSPGQHVFKLQNTGTKNPLSSSYFMSAVMAAENSGTAVIQRRNAEDTQVNRLHYESFRDLRQFLSLTSDQVGVVSSGEAVASTSTSTTLGYINSAFVMSDGSGTAVNCTYGVNGGVSTVDLSFTYTLALNPGTTAGELDVYVDGVAIPRKVAGTTQDAYYEEDLVTIGRIKFWANLSAAAVSIEVRRKSGTVDTSTTNTSRLATNFGVIVGSAAQVTAGIADYSTLTAALAAVSTGGKITLLSQFSSTETITISKRVTIVGQGYDSHVTGTVTLTSACDFATIRGLYATQFILQAGALGNQIVDCYWDTAPSDANTLGSNRITGMLTV